MALSSPATAAPDRPAVTVASFETKAGAAVTYEPSLVPVGATATVVGTGQTTVVLVVGGLPPNRAYGAHVHVNGCGPTGADAGPHYQKVPDPVQPSVNPAHANPRNEIWLDFTSDAAGTAAALSTVNWKFGEPRPKSVVIHAEHTHTEPGHAGTAGARLACINVDF